MKGVLCFVLDISDKFVMNDFNLIAKQIKDIKILRRVSWIYY